MVARTWGLNDGKNDLVENLTIYDQTYESFGEQGLAMPTYLPKRYEPDSESFVVDIVLRSADEPRRSTERINFDEFVVAAAASAGVGGQRRAHGERDEQIYDEVLERLSNDATIDGSEIEIILHDGEVTLSGSVPRAADRARAEVLADGVFGVVRVVNRLRVVPWRM
ncbi:MAG: BON domain-containing protein [Polyangiaceae bacterium]|nr:BON domain-containing protein [Polyangiaceae bacterium]